MICVPNSSNRITPAIAASIAWEARSWNNCISSRLRAPVRRSRRDKLLGTGPNRLYDDHAVPVGEKAVPFADRVPVGLQHQVLPGESRDQHQQARLRQMEVGEQGAGEAESETGIDKQI